MPQYFFLPKLLEKHVDGNSLHYLRLNSKLSMTQMSTDKSPIPTLSHLKLNQTPLGEHTQAMRVSVWVTLM